jgi:hypothetical protein
MRTSPRLRAAAALDAKRRGSVKTTPKPPSKRPGYAKKAAKQTRRKATFELLAHFDRIKVKPAPKGAMGLGPLMRFGYLKKMRRGYLRTAKLFPETMPPTSKGRSALADVMLPSS